MEHIAQAIKLKQLVDDLLTETDWESIEVDELIAPNICFEKKHFDGFVYDHYRIATTINLSKSVLANLEWNLKKRQVVNKPDNIIDYEVLEEFSEPKCKIKRQINSIPFFSKRETVFAQYMFVTDLYTWIIGFSVDHILAPPNDNMVRTSVPITAYKYTMINENTTFVQRLINANPNGNIPDFIVKSQVNNLAESLAKLGKELL